MFKAALETKFCIDRAVLSAFLTKTTDTAGPYHNLHCIYDEEEEQAVKLIHEACHALGVPWSDVLTGHLAP